MAPSTSTVSTTHAPTFRDLGVRPLINCRGTYTILSGSRVLPQVAEAMLAATEGYVEMDELMAGVGRRLAELTGAEWGYVAAGCAAALAEVAAACVTGGDPELMARLPDTTGLRDEIIMPRAQRNSYDRALRMTGARIVEVETLAELETAIHARTALLAITGDQVHLGQLSVAEAIAVARAHHVPCLVDAAAERPDVPNRYLALGADVVTYSGGKCLRGPQASGLVLGRKDLLQAAYLNAAPHHGLGRPMKAGKEEIMGLLAAVEAWVLGRDHQAEWRLWESYLETIRGAVAAIPSVRTELQQPGIANVAPALLISWDAALTGGTPADVHRLLWEGEPRIAVHLRPEGLMVMSYMMERGDDRIVAARLAELLARPGAAPAAPLEPPAVQLDGLWEVHTRYAFGHSVHAVRLEQDGAELRGTYRSRFESVALAGSVHGHTVEFSIPLGYESNRVQYIYRGLAEGDTLSGQVELGEYGRATWTAQRVPAA